MSLADVDVLALEARAMNAWPALRTDMVGGWALRFAEGYTKRANSASALVPEADFEPITRAVETLYAAQGLPAIFRITPLAPAKADILLAAAGYTMFDPSLVMCAPIEHVDVDSRVSIVDAPSLGWINGSARANDVPHPRQPVHGMVVRSIPRPAAFATLTSSGRAVAYGIAVYEREMVGLFDHVVLPEDRGRGYGRAITNTLLRWGHDIGAQTAYLQVRRANEVASNLYASVGFVEAYPYHYRISPR